MKKYILDPINTYFFAIFLISLSVYVYHHHSNIQPKSASFINSQQNETTELSLPIPITSSDGKIMVNKESTDDAVFKSIKTALLNANPGDIIIVMPGTYLECINISKNITIEGISRGPTKAIISCDGKFALNIKAEKTFLKNLTIKNTHKDIKGFGYGIIISEDSNSVEMENLNIQSTALNLVQHNGDIKIKNTRFLFGSGVVASQGSFSCDRCQWNENTKTGIDLTPKAHQSLKFSIKNSTITNTKGNAIYIDKNAQGVLSNIDFSNGKNGLFVNASKDLLFKNLSFKNFNYAMIVSGGADITVQNLQVSKMNKFAVAATGIGSKLTIKNSNFNDNPKVGEVSKNGTIYLDNVTYSNNQQKILTFTEGKVVNVNEKESK